MDNTKRPAFESQAPTTPVPEVLDHHLTISVPTAPYTEDLLVSSEHCICLCITCGLAFQSAHLLEQHMETCTASQIFVNDNQNRKQRPPYSKATNLLPTILTHEEVVEEPAVLSVIQDVERHSKKGGITLFDPVDKIVYR